MAAKTKAIIGVMPGQLTDGPRAGRWLDPHNARPAYHYIMLRGLAQLAAVMPKSDPARGEIMRAMQSGLRARNEDYFNQGAANKDKAMETLLLVNRAFADESEFLRAALFRRHSRRWANWCRNNRARAASRWGFGSGACFWRK